MRSQGLVTSSRSQDWKLGSASQGFSRSISCEPVRHIQHQELGSWGVEGVSPCALSLQLFPLSASGGCSGLEDQAELLGIQAERGKPMQTKVIDPLENSFPLLLFRHHFYLFCETNIHENHAASSALYAIV